MRRSRDSEEPAQRSPLSPGRSAHARPEANQMMPSGRAKNSALHGRSGNGLTTTWKPTSFPSFPNSVSVLDPGLGMYQHRDPWVTSHILLRLLLRIRCDGRGDQGGGRDDGEEYAHRCRFKKWCRIHRHTYPRTRTSAPPVPPTKAAPAVAPQNVRGGTDRDRNSASRARSAESRVGVVWHSHTTIGSQPSAVRAAMTR